MDVDGPINRIIEPMNDVEKVPLDNAAAQKRKQNDEMESDATSIKRVRVDNGNKGSAPAISVNDMFDMAMMYQQANKYDQAVAWFTCAATECDHAPSMFALAKYYGEQKNMGDAEKWFEKLIEKDIVRAHYHYSLFQLDTKQDIEKGILIATKGAEQKNCPDCCNLLGYIFEGKRAKYGKCNRELAYQWHQRANELNSCDSMGRMGIMLEEDAKKENDAVKKKQLMTQAMELYQRSMDLGSLVGKYNVATKWYEGWCDVAPDYGKAFPMLKTLAEDHKDPDAMLFLSSCYRQGHGVNADQVEARLWMKRGAEQNQLGCIRDLMIGYSRLWMPINTEEAKRYADQGAALGDTECQEWLGTYYSTRDGAKCEHWLKMIKKDTYKALFSLYFNGIRGINPVHPPDLAKAEALAKEQLEKKVNVVQAYRDLAQIAIQKKDILNAIVLLHKGTQMTDDKNTQTMAWNDLEDILSNNVFHKDIAELVSVLYEDNEMLRKQVEFLKINPHPTFQSAMEDFQLASEQIAGANVVSKVNTSSTSDIGSGSLENDL